MDDDIKRDIDEINRLLTSVWLSCVDDESKDAEAMAETAIAAAQKRRPSEDEKP